MLAILSPAARTTRTRPPAAGAHGPVSLGSLGPNSATSGGPLAAARCIGPESTVTIAAACLNTASDSSSVVSPARF